MTIQSIGSGCETSGTSKASSATSSQAAGATTDGSGDATRSKVSGPAQFLSRLQDLEKTDPAQAKEILGKMADKLRGAADKGGDHAARLTEMADRLQKAADTGDLSGLTPPARPQGGHHGKHHHATQAYSAASSTTQADPLAALTAEAATA